MTTTSVSIEPTTATLEIIPGDIQPFFSGSVPLPPSVDNAYKIVTFSKQGKTISRLGATPALEAFKKDAALLLTQAYADWSLINAIRDNKVRAKKTPLKVTLRAYFLTPWKRDLDGVFKFVIDAAFVRMQLNDNLVCQIDAEKFVDVLNPRVEIEVRCIVR